MIFMLNRWAVRKEETRNEGGEFDDGSREIDGPEKNNKINLLPTAENKDFAPNITS